MEANLYRFYTRVCKGVKCEYEPQAFVFPKGASNRNIRGYLPDFRLTIGPFVYYIEAKGTMDSDSLEKIRLFKTYYPRMKLYVVSYPTYKKIERHYKGYIPEWE